MNNNSKTYCILKNNQWKEMLPLRKIQLYPRIPHNRQNIWFRLFYPVQTRQHPELPMSRFILSLLFGVLVSLISFCPMYNIITSSIGMYLFSFAFLILCFYCYRWFLFLPQIMDVSFHYQRRTGKDIKRNQQSNVIHYVNYTVPYLTIPILLYSLGHIFILPFTIPAGILLGCFLSIFLLGLSVIYDTIVYQKQENYLF